MTYYEYKQTRETAHTELLNKYGVFFAFSKEQFDEGKKEGVEYYSTGLGMLVPKDNFEMFIKEQEGRGEEFIVKAKELFTPTEIIRYELGNYEYCIREDLTDTKEALEEFNFSDEEFRVAAKEYMSHCEY